MSQPVVDTLQISEALRKTGMEREQAEGLARVLGDELGEHVVAQGDLQTGFQEIRGQIQSVDHRVDLARTELVGQIRILDGKIDGVRTELGGRIDALDQKVDGVKTELGGRIDALDQKVDGVRTELGGRIDALDQKVDGVKTELGGRIDALDQKVDGVRTELGGRIDSVRTELAGEFRSLQATLRIVGGGVALVLAAMGFVTANAVLGTPTPAQWYAPPPGAVSAPAAGVAPSTPSS